MGRSSIVVPAERFLPAMLLMMVLAIVPARADEITEVNLLLDRVEAAWGNRDARALADCYSDHLLLALDPPGKGSGAAVFGKEKAIASLSMLFEAGKAPTTHEIVKRDIMIKGEELALMRLTILDRWEEGRSEITTTLAIALREEDAWRMCFGFPMFYQPTVLVTGLVPDSQARSLGLRVGDRITDYAGQKVEVDSQLVEMVQKTTDAPAGSGIQLGVARGAEYLQLAARPGPLGVKIRTRFLPDEGAHIIGVDEAHPIKEVVEQMAEAMRNEDWDSYLAGASPGGFLVFAGGGDDAGPLRLFSPRGGREFFEQRVKEAYKNMALKSFRCEEIRIIVKNNLALAAIRSSFENLDGEVARTLSLVASARQDGHWRWLSSLPMQMDIGLDPPLEIKVSAEETARLEETSRGSFAGVGLRLSKSEEGIRIDEVIPNGPAERASLIAGSVITEINGLKTRGMKLGDAVKLLRGPVGTGVELAVLAPESASPQRVNLVRDIIAITSVSGRILEPGIGLVVITMFSEETPEGVRRTLESLKEKGVRALIVDLSENTGGLYDALREVAAIFVGQDDPLWLVRKRDDRRTEQVMGTVPRAVDWPLAVLISSRTMGGELVAAALKDSGYAKLLGQPTPGLAILQQMEKQPAGTSKKVVVGRFLTASGKQLYGHGVSPHVWLDADVTEEDLLRRAVEELKGALPR